MKDYKNGPLFHIAPSGTSVLYGVCEAHFRLDDYVNFHTVFSFVKSCLCRGKNKRRVEECHFDRNWLRAIRDKHQHLQLPLDNAACLSRSPEGDCIEDLISSTGWARIKCTLCFFIFFIYDSHVKSGTNFSSQ